MKKALVVILILGCMVGFYLLKKREASKESWEAGAKANISMMNYTVSECLRSEKTVNEPEIGVPICADETEWMEFENYWGSIRYDRCEFKVDKENNKYTFCASYGDINALCTQSGCVFD